MAVASNRSWFVICSDQLVVLIATSTSAGSRPKKRSIERITGPGFPPPIGARHSGDSLSTTAILPRSQALAALARRGLGLGADRSLTAGRLEPCGGGDDRARGQDAGEDPEYEVHPRRAGD